jgi:putative ABC transport system substrate-binding protein
MRPLRRRSILVGWLAGLAADRSAHAQSMSRPARIGYLSTAALDSPDAKPIVAAFRDGLRERGLVEGADFVIEARGAGGRVDRFGVLAAELVVARVDVIVALNSLSGRAAQQASAKTPIVIAVMGDPVGEGFAASLARPGGNVTGLTFLGPDLVAKRIALLKEALPKASRFAVLVHPEAHGQRLRDEMMQQADATARSLGLQLQRLAVSRHDDIDAAFAAAVRERAEAVLVMPSPLLFNERRRITELGARHRLPVAGSSREYAELGCLMSYGASLVDLNRRAAAYVDRILKGATPADLPIEQPTRFELVVNLKAARALGVAVPQSLLLGADEVIR